MGRVKTEGSGGFVSRVKPPVYVSAVHRLKQAEKFVSILIIVRIKALLQWNCWSQLCSDNEVMSYCPKEAGAAERAPKAAAVGRMFTDISGSLEPNMDLQHGKKGVRGRKVVLAKLSWMQISPILCPRGLVEWLLKPPCPPAAEEAAWNIPAEMHLCPIVDFGDMRVSQSQYPSL